MTDTNGRGDDMHGESLIERHDSLIRFCVRSLAEGMISRVSMSAVGGP